MGFQADFRQESFQCQAKFKKIAVALAKTSSNLRIITIFPSKPGFPGCHT